MAGGGPLIGRELELAEMERMLSDARLLTVTGAGGCGKTRLALEFADRVAADGGCDEGSLCVPVMLASVRGEEELLDALLRALGARERFGASQMDVLIECLGAYRAPLLVLDNCEHVLASAAAVVGEMLDAVPAARMMATSRTPLHLGGERVLRLHPLSLPQEGGGVPAVVCSDSGRLFVDRAARASRGFALTAQSAPAVAEICRRLDGLPLAICLAAARVSERSAEEIASELTRHGALARTSGTDPLSQHRSVRASLDWSYRLLGDPERQALRCLSVFSGGFTAAAAHAVIASEASVELVRGLLARLQASGMIMPMLSRGEERWTLLQTVGEYAAHRLDQQGEDRAARDRHLVWFHSYAAQASSMLAGPDGHEPIDLETANLRRAHEHALVHDTAAALGMTASLARHWILAERFQEARTACAATLSAADEREDPVRRALVHCAGALVEMLGEGYAAALAGTRAGLALLSDDHGPGMRAECLRCASMVLIQTGADLDAGMRSAERAVELARSTDDRFGLAFALVNLATAAALCDRFPVTHASYAEFLSIRPACGHVVLRRWAENAAAWAHLCAGSPQQALEHADRAIALEGDCPSMTYFQLVGFRIQALARIGESARALREAEEALRAAAECGALQALPAIEMAMMVAQLTHGDLAGAQRSAEGLLRMPHLHTLACARETLARVALARGDLGRAAAQALELEAIAERAGSERQHMLARRLNGAAASAAGEAATGRELLHQALQSCSELGLERDAAETLEELALLAAQGGEIERAARLVSAAAAARTRLHCPPMPAVAERLDAMRAQLTGGVAHDGSDAHRWQAAWAQGQTLTLSEAIAYARRGRGPRDRPHDGWESLTPIETEVATLASGGMSNPEIAARLFISRGTVKMHLSNIYRKLEVANRTELANHAINAERDA